MQSIQSELHARSFAASLRPVDIVQHRGPNREPIIKRAFVLAPKVPPDHPNRRAVILIGGCLEAPFRSPQYVHWLTRHPAGRLGVSRDPSPRAALVTPLDADRFGTLCGAPAPASHPRSEPQRSAMQRHRGSVEMLGPSSGRVSRPAPRSGSSSRLQSSVCETATMGCQVVVTGATGGIGSAIVAHLAERGDHVVAVARPTAELNGLVGRLSGVTAGPYDLTHPGDIPAWAAALDAVDVLTTPLASARSPRSKPPPTMCGSRPWRRTSSARRN